MPKIAELKKIDGHLWARIPDFLFEQGKTVFLWTESEKKDVLTAERNRVVYAIEKLRNEAD